MNSYVVEIQQNCWLADTEGDPGRTLQIANAQRFDTMDLAIEALKDARKYRPFKNPFVYPVDDSKPTVDRAELIAWLASQRDIALHNVRMIKSELPTSSACYAGEAAAMDVVIRWIDGDHFETRQVNHLPWRTIDSAPKDGTKVLLYWPNITYEKDDELGTDWIDVGYWKENSRTGESYFGYNDERDDYGMVDNPPTHWQPLIPPNEES